MRQVPRGTFHDRRRKQQEEAEAARLQKSKTKTINRFAGYFFKKSAYIAGIGSILFGITTFTFGKYLDCNQKFNTSSAEMRAISKEVVERLSSVARFYDISSPSRIEFFLENLPKMPVYAGSYYKNGDYKGNTLRDLIEKLRNFRRVFYFDADGIWLNGHMNENVRLEPLGLDRIADILAKIEFGYDNYVLQYAQETGNNSENPEELRKEAATNIALTIHRMSYISYNLLYRSEYVSWCSNPEVLYSHVMQKGFRIGAIKIE